MPHQRTIETYGLAVEQLGAYLREQGMPSDPTQRHPRAPHRVDALPAAARRRRGRGASSGDGESALPLDLSLLRFLVERRRSRESPLAKMTPPKVPEKLVPVVKEADLAKLLRSLSGTDFEAAGTRRSSRYSSTAACGSARWRT